MSLSERINQIRKSNSELERILRPCPRCLQLRVNGQDPCIADLPNVRSACCGHGVTYPYVVLNDGTQLTDSAAVAYFIGGADPRMRWSSKDIDPGAIRDLTGQAHQSTEAARFGGFPMRRIIDRVIARENNVVRVDFGRDRLGRRALELRIGQRRNRQPHLHAAAC
jgi:hypothetical protein